MGFVKESEEHWEALALKVKTELVMCIKEAETSGNWGLHKLLNQLHKDTTELSTATLDFYRALNSEDHEDGTPSLEDNIKANADLYAAN